MLSGLYETLQFPFSYLSGEKEEALVRLCEKHDVGFICMKALAGGLITKSDVAYAFLAQYPVAPIWGIQRESELNEFLSYQDNPPTLTEEMKVFIEGERAELERFVAKISTPVMGWKRKLTRLKGRFVFMNFSGTEQKTIHR